MINPLAGGRRNAPPRKFANLRRYLATPNACKVPPVDARDLWLESPATLC